MPTSTDAILKIIELCATSYIALGAISFGLFGVFFALYVNFHSQGEKYKAAAGHILQLTKTARNLIIFNTVFLFYSLFILLFVSKPKVFHLAICLLGVVGISSYLLFVVIRASFRDN